MKSTPNFRHLAIASAKRAVELEGVTNLCFAVLRQTGPKDFQMQYGFFEAPNDTDLEALSLIETEMVSDIWSWVGDFDYNWSILSSVPEHSDNIVVYQA